MRLVVLVVALVVAAELELAAVELAREAALEVALVVAPVASAELELGVLERALGVVPALERAAVRRVVAVRERAAGLASAVVAVGQGLAEEERALPGALE